MQFYFLSIFFNMIGGLSLAIDSIRRRNVAIEGLGAFLRDSNVRLVVGILTTVTAAFKLLTVIRGDIPIVGDFVPAMAGLAVGITLLLELYRSTEGDTPFGGPISSRADEASCAGVDASGKPDKEAGNKARKTDRIENILIQNKAAIGIAGMIAALVHFLFPAVLFL